MILFAFKFPLFKFLSCCWSSNGLESNLNSYHYLNHDKVLNEEMMMNDDNLESNLLTSCLLKICSLYKFCRVQVAHVELDVCVEVVPASK